jgi:hypothetical protein
MPLGPSTPSGVDTILGPVGNRCRDLVLVMIVARIIVV